MTDTYDYHGALLKTNLIPPNTHPKHTANLIQLSPFGPEPDPTEFINWMRQYRGFRDQGDDAEEAAEHATEAWFETEETTMTELPEAPFSANFRTQSDVQITVRAPDWDTFLRRLERAEARFRGENGQGDTETPSQPQGGGGSPSAPQNGDTERIYKYEIAVLPEDKYQLVIYPVLGDGNEGRYPLTKFTATGKSDFYEMLKPVWDDIDARGGIPSKGAVNWIAHTAEGREYTKKDGTTGRYTDLVRLEKE